jgi:hypothetical protein
MIILWLTVITLVGCNLPSGGGAGPTVWIDRPLDGESFSLAPLTIQAHASDADGVATIEFYISEGLLAAAPAGGGRLGEASIEWMPPGEGIYTISAGAVDSQGNSGPTTSVQIVVGAADLTTETPTPAPASPQCALGALVAPVLLSPANGSTIAPDPLFAWSYPDETCHPHSYRIDISEDASLADVSLGFGTLDYNETSRQWPLPPGKCYYWRALAYVPDVNGPASPAWTFCVEGATPTPTPAPALPMPCQPTVTANVDTNVRAGPAKAYRIVGTLVTGQSANVQGRSESTFGNWWYIQHSGASGGHGWVWGDNVTAVCIPQNLPVVAAPPLPATDTPTPSVVTKTPTPTPAVVTDTPTPAPADLTPPDISDLSANPTTISVQVPCGATPATTVIRARVTDPGGIASVVARVSGVGEFAMSPAGGGYYQVTLGPFNEAGELSIFVQAQDNAGNTAYRAPLTVYVVACPG